MLYILHSGNLYGTERMALATMRALPEYRRRIVLAPPGTAAGSALAAAEASGMQACSFTDRASLMRQLRKVMSEEPELDVVTTSITQSLLVASVGKTTGCRLRHLHAVHGNGDEASFRFKAILSPLRLRYMAVSSHVRDLLISSHVPARKIIIAENFLEQPAVEDELARASYVNCPPGTDGPVRVVVVGRADEVKRLDLLVKAVVDQGLTEMQIDVYGGGPNLEALRAAASGCPNLTFHGFSSRVAHHIRSADFLAHTCAVETFGLVVLEAFQAGVVVVVPDTGGTATLVEPGRTGLRYQAGDAADLTAQLRKAATLTDRALDRMARTAAFELRTRFSSEQGARTYRDAFALLGH